MVKIKFHLSLCRCHISLLTFCINLFPSSSFCFHAKPQSYCDPTVFSLIICGSLFSLTSYHSYFLITLDSVSYLTWIITTIKNQKLFTPLNLLHNSKQLLLNISMGEYYNTVFISSHRIDHKNIVFQFQCKQFCLIKKKSIFNRS